MRSHESRPGLGRTEVAKGEVVEPRRVDHEAALPGPIAYRDELGRRGGVPAAAIVGAHRVRIRVERSTTCRRPGFDEGQALSAERMPARDLGRNYSRFSSQLLECKSSRFPVAAAFRGERCQVVLRVPRPAGQRGRAAHARQTRWGARAARLSAAPGVAAVGVTPTAAAGLRVRRGTPRSAVGRQPSRPDRPTR